MVAKVSMKISFPLVWQSKDGKYQIKLSRRCVQRMCRMSIAHYPNEVGTPLVGYYSSDCRTAYVTSLAPLPPDSRGERFSFWRGVVGLQEFFQRLGRRFQGK